MSHETSARMRKVNELVREIVADEVTELKDPGLGFVTVTAVDTAPDLRHAIVYYSVLGSEEVAASTAEALGRAHSRLQRAIGRQARLKFTPVLEFRPDDAVARGIRINELLAGLDAAPDGNEEAM
ncbi:MAG TPA: 30S ribosome-binding factor RbfA [Acidimicrobiia bacterium]